MNSAINTEVINVLSSNICAALSSVSALGTLHSNTIYYCYDNDLNLYFASDCTTLHVKNIQENCNVAMCIWETPKSYGKEHVGLQIEGVCSEIRGLDLLQVWGLYIKRFPIFQQTIGTFDDLLNKVVNMRLFKIEPRRIQLTNSIIYGPQMHYYTNEGHSG